MSDILWPLLGSIGLVLFLAAVGIGLSRRLPPPSRDEMRGRPPRQNADLAASAHSPGEDQPGLIQLLDGFSGRAKVGLLAGLLYFGAYPFLSSAGHWESAGAYMEWTPYGASLDVRTTSSGNLRTKGSLLGFVYAPLMIVDRALFHRSIVSNSPEGREAQEQERQWRAYDRNE